MNSFMLRLICDRRSGTDGFYDFRRQRKTYVLWYDFNLFQVRKSVIAKEIDRLFDQVLRRGGPGGEGHGLHILQPL